MPEYTGRVMERIPDFIPVWSLVLGGIYWISHRRDEVAEAEAAEAEEKEWGCAMKIRLTFWKAVFARDHGPGPLLLIHSLFPRLGCGLKYDRPIPLGPLDRLRLPVRRHAGGRRLHAWCGAVYLFNVERLHSVVRPAVLTAFLGYVLFIVGLLFDLGRPWYIWHQLIYMNPHSVMFEVGMCVMTYTTVLFFEFLPNVFERFNLQSPHQVDQENLPGADRIGHFAFDASPEFARLALSDYAEQTASHSGIRRLCRSSFSVRRLQLDWQ